MVLPTAVTYQPFVRQGQQKGLYNANPRHTLTKLEEAYTSHIAETESIGDDPKLQNYTLYASQNSEEMQNTIECYKLNSRQNFSICENGVISITKRSQVWTIGNELQSEVSCMHKNWIVALHIPPPLRFQ